MHMDLGAKGWARSHADERSRARAARGLAATVYSRTAERNMAREVGTVMSLKWGIRKAGICSIMICLFVLMIGEKWGCSSRPSHYGITSSDDYTQNLGASRLTCEP